MFKRARASIKCHLSVALLVSTAFLLLMPSLAGASPLPQTGKWYAEYFNNQTLSGSPVLTRYDNAVDFNWGTGSPGEGVPVDHFSARWTREEWFENGTYRFVWRSDDGIRVWVGNRIVVDAWTDQQAAWNTTDVYIDRGTYQVRVEYFENTGGAQVFLDWTRITGGEGWIGQYFTNQKLEGNATLVRFDKAIDFAWGTGSPDPSIPDDHFSVRWTYNLTTSAGTYRFLTSTDDGVRLWVDGQLLIDKWYKQKLPNTHTGDIGLSGGPHEIKVEYFEEGGEAHAHVWWQRLDGYAGWKAEYFDNRDLVGGPALVRDDAEIKFDWGLGPPVSWMPDDNFSARWTREITLDPGYYRFSVQSDDGVRVWLDDALIIDQWREMNYELHYVDGTYLSGPHRFKVEYFEKNGTAGIHFLISRSSEPAQAQPPTPPAPSPPPPAPQGPWRGSYFANETLAGDPASVRDDDAIDFDWKLGAPDPALPVDHFSARWQTTVNFPAGRYRFTTYSDDGVRLYVDGQRVLNSWWPMRGYRSTIVPLTEGTHTLVLEYFERTGAAAARLSWTWIGSTTPPAPKAPTAPAGAAGPWQGEYFDNPNLEGDAKLSRTEEVLAFDWGYGAPAPGIPSDDFAARWTTTRSFSAGRYTFTTYSDDGVRLYVDGRLVINSWRPMRGYRSATVNLSAGEHTIVLEYFERSGVALVRLNW